MDGQVKSASPDAVKGISKKSYLDNIFLSSKIETFKSMGGNKENDANTPAKKKRNGDMPYTNGQKPIVFLGFGFTA